MQAHREVVNVVADGGSFNGGAFTRTYTKTTTDATAAVILEISLAQLESVGISGFVKGSKSDFTAGIFRPISCGFRRASGGNVTSEGTASGTDVEDSGGTPAVTVVADTVNQKAQIKVTGIVSETWKWEAYLTYVKLK